MAERINTQYRLSRQRRGVLWHGMGLRSKGMVHHGTSMLGDGRELGRWAAIRKGKVQHCFDGQSEGKANRNFSMIGGATAE